MNLSLLKNGRCGSKVLCDLYASAAARISPWEISLLILGIAKEGGTAKREFDDELDEALKEGSGVNDGAAPIDA